MNRKNLYCEKFAHEGKYAAEVAVDLTEDDTAA
jgi:hypothetical protein